MYLISSHRSLFGVSAKLYGIVRTNEKQARSKRLPGVMTQYVLCLCKTQQLLNIVNPCDRTYVQCMTWQYNDYYYVLRYVRTHYLPRISNIIICIPRTIIIMYRCT